MAKNVLRNKAASINLLGAPKKRIMIIKFVAFTKKIAKNVLEIKGERNREHTFFLSEHKNRQRCVRDERKDRDLVY